MSDVRGNPEVLLSSLPEPLIIQCTRVGRRRTYARSVRQTLMRLNSSPRAAGDAQRALREAVKVIV